MFELDTVFSDKRHGLLPKCISAKLYRCLLSLSCLENAELEAKQYCSNQWWVNFTVLLTVVSMEYWNCQVRCILCSPWHLLFCSDQYIALVKDNNKRYILHFSLPVENSHVPHILSAIDSWYTIAVTIYEAPPPCWNRSSRHLLSARRLESGVGFILK